MKLIGGCISTGGVVVVDVPHLIVEEMVMVMVVVVVVVVFWRGLWLWWW